MLAGEKYLQGLVETANVVEMLASGRALFELYGLPLVHELLRGHQGAHAEIPLD